MKAVGYRQSLPISHAEALIDLEIAEPTLGEHDLCVKVQAVSVNPVDTKIRKGVNPEPGETKILGWDATGEVEAVGSAVTLFKPGDQVWYAGALNRAGTNSELHVVDERIVGHKPKSLSYADAAALPLTTITAWEILFDRFALARSKASSDKSIVIIGAGGGVGSIMVQLARKLTGLRVIGTASRPETRDWVYSLGAHEVIDHSHPLDEELKRIGVASVGYIASLTSTDQHFASIVEAIAPQGHIGVIDDPEMIDVRKLKRKSVAFHWEFMFTRSLFATPDQIAQHHLLSEMATLIDEKMIRTTVGEHFGIINAENLKRAHQLIESGRSRGKVVLEGF